jgi:hypothetical protein
MCGLNLSAASVRLLQANLELYTEWGERDKGINGFLWRQEADSITKELKKRAEEGTLVD